MPLNSEEQIGEIPLELTDDLDPELVEEFISDAREQLENIERGALALENNTRDHEVIHNLFRAFHTLKGNAGFIDFTAISQLAHTLESLLDGAREERLEISPAIIEIILTSRDTIKKFVDEVQDQVMGKKPRQVVLIPTAALKAKTRQILEDAVNFSTPPVSADEFTSEDEGVEITAATAVEMREMPASSNYVSGTALHAVKVATTKLDGLVDLAGELLIAQSLVAQSAASPETNRHIMARNLDQLTRISKELQRTAMSMRMVPIRATFQKMHRLVRGIAAKQNKKVALVLVGEDTEVDRTIVEKLGDPLMHMVCNAIDHAIELPEERVAQGKPPTGTITLRAYHKSGNMIIEVEDDGVGLNRERILEKATKAGLWKSAEKPADKELLAMILQPGFTTASVVTNISGRGVGMDVVNKNICQLRGKIDVRSTPGQGTVFTIRLPLTLAIIDGMLIGVDHQRYILPTSAVRESFDPKMCRITTLPGGGEVAEVRHEVIPLLRLREHFQFQERSVYTGRGIIIVIEADGKKRCLLADELLGKQEVVVKNLGELFRTDPMVSGGAILGDGCVGLILDAAALVNLEPANQDLLLAI
jgi:two-component system chemotaxis sensor kinase CheA